MIELPEGLEGAHITFWCSLFCDGTEATGELNAEFPDGQVITIPVCEECAEKVISGAPEYALDLT
jgi:hypothetical protein